MIGLLVSTNWKIESYDSIFVIVYHLIKMVNEKLLRIMINRLGFAEVIIDIIIKYHELPNFIIMD